MRCRHHVPLSWPKDIRDLIQRCWHADSYSRPCMREVLQSLSDIQANYTPSAHRAHAAS
jgi:hypothetical protein